MDKLNYLKTNRQAFRDLCRMSRNYRQPEYKDTFLREGEKVPFKHEWRILAHMHDLRLWTLAYAPARKNNLQRM